MASAARSKLISRVSRSSLQLNLRTNQPSPNPILSPSPVQSPGGTWEGPNLTPSPACGAGGKGRAIDPAFLKEQQMQMQYQAVRGAATGAAAGGGQGGGEGGRYSKENMHRNGAMGYNLNRQDDGRLQLEQERLYLKQRIAWTWTR
ncbi:hypothetical protein BG004_000240, partial [Podila humilis]